MTTRQERLLTRKDVVFLDELRIAHPCSRCFPGESVEDIDIRLLSPRGVIHEGSDYGMTTCGVNATGPGWWWAE